jgi:hypothetical protein
MGDRSALGVISFTRKYGTHYVTALSARDFQSSASTPKTREMVDNCENNDVNAEPHARARQ